MLITAWANHGLATGRGVIGHARSADLLSWTVGPPLTEPAGYGHGISMGAATERYQAGLGISRAEQDEFAAESHTRAAVAIKDGRLAEEVTPVTITSRKGFLTRSFSASRKRARDDRRDHLPR